MQIFNPAAGIRGATRRGPSQTPMRDEQTSKEVWSVLESCDGSPIGRREGGNVTTPQKVEPESSTSVAGEPQSARGNTLLILAHFCPKCSEDVHHAEKGMALDLGAGAHLELIDEDEGNLSLQVTWGKVRIALLLRTKLSQTASLALLSVIILSSVSSARLLQDIETTVAVIEGRNPLATTCSRPTLLATNDRGWIEHVTNGERLWVVRLG